MFKFEKNPDRYLTRIGQNNVEYEIFKIIEDKYDPRLKEKAIPWDFAKPPTDLYYLAASTVKTMVRAGGIGLSATQIGLPWAFFSMGGLDGKAWFIVNPTIVKGDGEDKSQEGCLSFPGLYMNVKRHMSVDVVYYDLYGQKKEETFEGLTARVFQHEFDHLNGITFVQKVSDIVYERAKAKVKANLKQIEEIRKNAPAISDPKAQPYSQNTSVEYTIKV